MNPYEIQTTHLLDDMARALVWVYDLVFKPEEPSHNDLIIGHGV